MKILVSLSHACNEIFTKSMDHMYVKPSDSLRHIFHIPDKLKFLQNNYGACPVFLATPPIPHQQISRGLAPPHHVALANVLDIPSKPDLFSRLWRRSRPAGLSDSRGGKAKVQGRPRCSSTRGAKNIAGWYSLSTIIGTIGLSRGN